MQEILEKDDHNGGKGHFVNKKRAQKKKTTADCFSYSKGFFFFVLFCISVFGSESSEVIWKPWRGHTTDLTPRRKKTNGFWRLGDGVKKPHWNRLPAEGERDLSLVVTYIQSFPKQQYLL